MADDGALRIWFDILTPKQVMFFGPAVSFLRGFGHDVLCTSRRYPEVQHLAELKGLHILAVGWHGGPDRYGKLVASAERTRGLAGVVKDFEPDVAISFGSPEAARVAFGLGIRHTCFNDSPHSEAVARLTVPLTDELLTPWVIPSNAWSRFGARQITQYRALDPAAWLKQASPAKVQGTKAFIRLEESHASYIADMGLSATPMVDAAVKHLSKDMEVVLLCRYQEQLKKARERYPGVDVRALFDGVSLLNEARLFIGAGGTMSAEAALMGIPTVSIAPVRFHTERYLVRTGLVARAGSEGALVRLCREMMSAGFVRQQQRLASRTLSGMENPTGRIIKAAVRIG